MSIGPAGERGKTGDHGQTGEAGHIGATGKTGAQGPQGRSGLRGRALTWVQALVMFLLIVLIGLVMAFTFERQQARLETNQVAIQENSNKIAEERYLGCLGGVQIISKFNTKNRRLAEIERSLLQDPAVTPLGKRIAKERIKAYEDTIIVLPEPACRR